MAKQAAVGATLQTIDDYARVSAAAGGFDRADAVLERRTARLDERGWKALTTEAQKFLDRIEKIEADAAKRLEKGGEDGAIDAGVVLLGFESVPLSEQIPETKKKRAPMKRTRTRGAAS
jgi:hypothetical protein